MGASNRSAARSAFWARLRRVLTEEVGELGLDRFGALVISHSLPQLSFARTRTTLLRALGWELGPRTFVLGPLRITGKGRIRGLVSFGTDVIVTGPLHIDVGAEVRIGNNVYFGHDAAILTIDHHIGPPGRRCAAIKPAPVAIGEGAWISARVTILPGVVIGPGAVVAAGAVVTRDVAPNTLVGGVPARLIRTLDNSTRENDSRSRAP